MARTPWCVFIGLGGLLLLVLGCAPRTAPSAGTTTAPALTLVDWGEDVVNEMPAWAGKDKNEPFDVQAFLAPRLGPANQAAKRMLHAMAAISGDLSRHRQLDLSHKAEALAAMDTLAADHLPSAEVDKLLRQAAKAIEQVDAAMQQSPCVFNARMQPESLFTHLSAVTIVKDLSLLQVKQGSVRGDNAQVQEALERSLRMARELQPRGPVLCQLESMKIEANTLEAIERVVLANPDLTVEQIDRLLEVLLHHQKQMSNRTAEGLKMEFVMNRNGLEALQTGSLTLREVCDYLMPDSHADSFGPLADMKPPPLNFSAEIAACSELHKVSIEAAEQPSYSATRLVPYETLVAKLHHDGKEMANAVEAAPLDQRAELRSQAPAYLIYVLAPTLEPFLEVDCRTTARLSATQMLLALRRYELVHGRLPADLHAAAAETKLQQVPLDPYDGQPLRYVIVAGKPIVYSVGKDRIDQQGEVDARDGLQPGDYLYVLPRFVNATAGSTN